MGERALILTILLQVEAQTAEPLGKMAQPCLGVAEEPLYWEIQIAEAAVETMVVAAVAVDL